MEEIREISTQLSPVGGIAQLVRAPVRRQDEQAARVRILVRAVRNLESRIALLHIQL